MIPDPRGPQAARWRQRKFELLRSFPEFRDLIVVPAPLASPGAGNSAKKPAANQPKAKRKGAVLSPNDPTLVADQALSAKSRVPKINLGPKKRGWPAWLQWLLFGLVAGAAAVVGWFLFRH